MWRSDNGGATWTKRDAGTTFRDGFGGFGWYFGTMAVSPNNPEFSYALGVQTMRSTNGGTSYFYQNGTTLHVDQHAVFIQPSNNQRVFIGSDGGFYRTLNGGSSWSKLGALPITQFYAITVNPQDNLQRFGGTQDNNTLTGTTNPGTWSAILGGDGFYCIVDHTNPAVVFAEFQNMCSGTGPRRNGAQPTGFNPGDRYNWNAPYVMDPTDHNILLAGSHRIYKSVDNGVSYTVVSGDLAFAPGTSRPNGTLSTITISPVDNQIYYTGSNNGKVWRSTDGGANWTDKTGTLPVRAITRVTADPFDANTIFVSLSGFNGSNEEPVHLYKSTDLGDTWVNVSGNLPNAPVNDILIDNVDPQRWYAGTDLGVWTTQNGGSTWYPLGQGLPFQAVFDLYLHEGARELYAGTHGRSMWKVNLSELPTAVDAGPAPRLALSAPSPNPSRGVSHFSLSLDREARVNVSVFDALGRRTGVIHEGTLSAGRHSLAWDGRDAGGRAARSGVYFLRAESDDGIVLTKRIVRTQCSRCRTRSLADEPIREPPLRFRSGHRCRDGADFGRRPPGSTAAPVVGRPLPQRLVRSPARVPDRRDSAGDLASHRGARTRGSSGGSSFDFGRTTAQLDPRGADQHRRSGHRDRRPPIGDPGLLRLGRRRSVPLR